MLQIRTIILRIVMNITIVLLLFVLLLFSCYEYIARITINFYDYY